MGEGSFVSRSSASRDVTRAPPTAPSGTLADAAYKLAQQLTGLPPDLLRLVNGDQVTDSSILNLAVPERTRPAFRALSPANRPVLEPPPGQHAKTAQADMPQDRLEAALTYSYFAVVLSRLIGGRRQCIAAARLPKFVRAQLDELRCERPPRTRPRRLPRESHRALQQLQRVDPPAATATAIRTSRSTAIA